MVGTKDKHWVKSLWMLATHDVYAPFLQRIRVVCSFEIPVWTHKYVLLLQYSRSHICERFSFVACEFSESSMWVIQGGNVRLLHANWFATI